MSLSSRAGRRPAAILIALLAIGGGWPVPSAEALAFQLRVAVRPDRAESVALDGATVRGVVHAFAMPDLGVRSVTFWLDAPTTASPVRVEVLRPFDFGGTRADGSPIGWDTRGVAPGPHVMTARFDTPRGRITVQAAFQVAAVLPAPTASPGSTTTPRPTATASPIPTATPSPRPTATPSPRPTATPTATPSPSPIPTPTASATAAPPSGMLVPATPGALAAAIAGAPNGATLILRGGDHVNGFISTAKSLTLRAYPDETPVITHPTARPDFLYFRGGPVLVEGITFRMGVNAPTFDDSMGSALTEVVDGGHDVTYVRCTFIGNANASGRQQLLYIAGGAGQVTVRDSTFDYQGGRGSGVHAYHDPGAGLVVERNVFRDFGYEAAVLIDQTGAGKVVTANTFHDTDIAIQHVKSGGTTVSDNTGHGVRIGVDVRSSANLTQSGNVWNP